MFGPGNSVALPTISGFQTDRFLHTLRYWSNNYAYPWL